MAREPVFRCAHVVAQDAGEAARELHSQLAMPGAAVVLLFVSPAIDPEALLAALQPLFAGVPLVGCTTAGEIGALGYREGSVVAVAFSSSAFAVASVRLPGASTLDAASAQAASSTLVREIEDRARWASDREMFALLLVDGLSVSEERLARALQTSLGRIPLVGGSAGDGLDFRRTRICHGGAWHDDAAVLLLVATRQPFQPFMTQQYEVCAERMVVTAADPGRRIVHEIDGRPAVEAYAELVGLTAPALGPEAFAAAPVAVLIGGAGYVRAISKALPDGSLKFFCAIDEGMILHAVRPGDPVANLERALAAVEPAVGPGALLVGFECILRRLELAQRGLVPATEALLRPYAVAGFATYGEQYRGLHLNQTFTGIAIGATRPGTRP